MIKMLNLNFFVLINTLRSIFNYSLPLQLIPLQEDLNVSPYLEYFEKLPHNDEFANYQINEENIEVFTKLEKNEINLKETDDFEIPIENYHNMAGTVDIKISYSDNLLTQVHRPYKIFDISNNGNITASYDLIEREPILNFNESYTNLNLNKAIVVKNLILGIDRDSKELCLFEIINEDGSVQILSKKNSIYDYFYRKNKNYFSNKDIRSKKFINILSSGGYLLLVDNLNSNLIFSISNLSNLPLKFEFTFALDNNLLDDFPIVNFIHYNGLFIFGLKGAGIILQQRKNFVKYIRDFKSVKYNLTEITPETVVSIINIKFK